MSRYNRGMLLAMAVLFSAFLAGGASQLRADDWGGNQRYYDRDGFGTGSTITTSTTITTIIADTGTSAMARGSSSALVK